MNSLRIIFGAVLAQCVLTLAGCNAVNPKVAVHEPTSVRPVAQVPAQVNTGAIFPGQQSYRPLFEDRKPRVPGDLLVININERLSASQKASTNASKTGSAAFGVPTVSGLPIKGLQGAELSANSSNKFEGKGGTEGANAFTGTIAVTVIETLPNGNLLVSGEKQIGIHRNTETLRVSGVVNPATVYAGNQVSSTDVADVRIDYRGRGSVDDAQLMGWLARVFLSVLPF